MGNKAHLAFESTFHYSIVPPFQPIPVSFLKKNWESSRLRPGRAMFFRLKNEHRTSKKNKEFKT